MKKKWSGSRGMMVLEAVIAMFLFAIVIISVMALMSSARRLDRDDLLPQQEAAQAVQDLRVALANYVTADHDAGLVEFAPAPVGPGLETDREHHPWRLPGDRCDHAFQPNCTHNATAFLPDSFRVQRSTACLTYTVTPPAGDDAPAKVEFKVGWRDDACVVHAL